MRRILRTGPVGRSVLVRLSGVSRFGAVVSGRSLPVKLVAGGVGVAMAVSLVSSGQLNVSGASDPVPTVLPASLSTCGFGSGDGSAGGEPVTPVPSASATPVLGGPSATVPDFEQSL